MNIKSILTCLAVLTLFFNIFALETQGKPTITTPDQTSSFIKTTVNQEHSSDTHLANNVVNSQTIPQTSTEKSSEFITALSVYSIIIIVYSIYGFKANSKNVRN